MNKVVLVIILFLVSIALPSQKPVSMDDDYIGVMKVRKKPVVKEKVIKDKIKLPKF